MGICSSTDATSVATAKLIMPDGRLQEYSQPIKAHYVLQRLKNPTVFICNSDEMDFNDVVSPLNDDEVLHLGQLYFVLPLKLLKYPLKAADMAELAVRASNALMKSCGGNGGGVDSKWLSNVESVGDGSWNLERRRMRSQSVDLGGGVDSKWLSNVESVGDGSWNLERRRMRSQSVDLGGGGRIRRGVEVGGSGRRRRRTHSTDLGVILE